jgi:hypothetical protein
MTISIAQENNRDSSFYRENGTGVVFPNDVVFDSVNIIPFQFVQKDNEILHEKKEYIEKNLKEETMPIMPFYNDWIIGVIIFSIMLFSIVYASSKTFFTATIRFFLFRGTTEKENKATKLFRWESMLLNISSIFIISIFAYFAVSYNGIMTGNLTVFKIWLFSTGIIVIALILRHFICITIGLISGLTEIFNNYIITVYQAYKLTGFFIFIVTVLFFYTPLINAKSYFITGCTVVAIFYLIRVFRLFFLFINYKVSIFYLILYLCALEVLPVLILIKYFPY